jgi:hypothetical protein
MSLFFVKLASTLLIYTGKQYNLAECEATKNRQNASQTR